MASPAALKLTVSVLPETVPEGVSMKWGAIRQCDPGRQADGEEPPRGLPTGIPAGSSERMEAGPGNLGRTANVVQNPADAST
jgi:hypothetical protein